MPTQARTVGNVTSGEIGRELNRGPGSSTSGTAVLDRLLGLGVEARLCQMALLNRDVVGAHLDTLRSGDHSR